jgi:hypothetical protein
VLTEAAGELAAGTKWETPARLLGSIVGLMAPRAGARAFNALYDALPGGAGALGGKLIQPAARVGAGARLPQAPAASQPPATPPLTGQIHHGISKVIHRAIEKIPGLAGVYNYRDARFVTRAIDNVAHRGYQK